MLARIYRPAPSATQSGIARSQQWVLEFEPETAKKIDPLMGWTSSGDMRGQVKLRFDTKEAAAEYAKAHGIPFRIAEPKQTKPKLKAYADNFRYDRKQPWSH